MRRPTAILLLALASASFGLIGPELDQLLSKAQPDQQLMVHIVMKEQFDAELLTSMVDGLPRPERRMAVAQILQDFSAERQAGLLDCLQDAEAQGRVSSITSFWIVNAVYCEATPDVVMEVSSRTDVNYVDYDLRDVPDFPEPEEPGGEPEEVAWGVERISAPDVWAMGWTGAGIVCGHIDTGVDYTHPDLADHMWTDPYYPNHGWDFKNVDDNPMDEHSHGTHTAGTVASDGKSGTKCGVAPDAQIMALRVADGQQTSENHVWQAMEFCISPPLSPDNGADLYTMSLGWLMQWEPSRATWRTLSNNVNAAGLVQVTIVGNERGSVFPPNAVRCPGDVPPPWPNPQNTGTGGLSGIMSVGATNADDDCASFSSPGPVTWQNVPGFEDYVYPPGLTRPDMSAPGVDISTCRLGGGYASALGTSMAAPHVAGTVCLMLSKCREHGLELTPRQVDSLLETTAIDRGLPGKDNDYGAGLINALAAVVATPSVIAISDREQAIAAAQGKHIVRSPRTRELHVVYQASGGVYWTTSSDDGFSWSTAELVAPGANPCISLDFKGLPWVAYSSEENGWRRRLYCAVRRPNGTWARKLVHQDPGAHFGAPSLVCSNWRNDAVPNPPPPDMGYLVAQGTFQSGVSDRVLFIPFDTAYSNPEGTYSYTVMDLSSSTGMDASHPCISRTPGDFLHVTWMGMQQDGSRGFYYQTVRDRTDPAQIRSFDFPVFTPAHPLEELSAGPGLPVNDAYGDLVTGVWRAEELARGRIHEKHRYVYGPPDQWSEVEPWSEGNLEAGFPAMSRCAGVWQQQPQSEFPDGVVCRFAGDDHPAWVTQNHVVDHLYPQADVQLAQAPGSYDTLRVIWTEPLGSGQYAICFARFPHLNAGPGWFYEIVCGQEDASPYCIHRDGHLALDEYSLDFAESELVYRLSYLNPLYRYRVSATVYHEGSAPLLEVLTFPLEDGTEIAGASVYALPGEPVEVEFEVPAILHGDGAADLVIRRFEGDYAAVAGIQLHEYEPSSSTSGSGSQSADRMNLRRPPAILGVLPNPFTRATTIRYQVLDAGPVSLKILDVTGRCVREVKTDSRRSGIYAAPWDGLDDHNRALPNGVYFCQLESNGSRSTAKVCLTR